MKRNIETIKKNLFWKLRKSVFVRDFKDVVTIGWLFDKINAYAPKAILNDKDAFVDVVHQLWAVTHDYGINSEDFLREDLEWETEKQFGNN